MFGLRKFDLVKTIKGIKDIKGKRSKVFFDISDVFGNQISDSVNIEKNCELLKSRTNTLSSSQTQFYSQSLRVSEIIL